MSDDQDSGEIDHISKNNEERVADDIEVIKIKKLSSKRNDDNIEKEHDEINQMDMSDYKYSDERYQIDKKMNK